MLGGKVNKVNEMDQSHKAHNTPVPYPTSHNVPFRIEMCAFLFWMVHHGIWDKGNVGFVKLVYSKYKGQMKALCNTL